MRENFIGRIWTYFWFYFVISTVFGAVMFFSSAHTMNNLMDNHSIDDPRSGQLYNGTYEIGMSTWMIIVWVHIVMWWFEMRSWNMYIWIGVALSVICYWGQLNINNKLARGPYFMWSWNVYQCP